MKNKICIVGWHADTRDLTPWGDPDYDFIVFNAHAMKVPPGKLTYSLQLHVPEIYTSDTNPELRGYWDWLQKDTGIIHYMQEVDPRVPNSVRYPREEIEKEFYAGVKFTDGKEHHNLTCSATYAMALCLHLGYKEIELYGVELSSGTEYEYQRESFIFWGGIALGRGVTITLHSAHTMFENPILYGYNAEINLGKDYYLDRAYQMGDKWQSQRARVDMMKHNLKRAIDNHLYDEAADLLVTIEEAAIEDGRLAGALCEAHRYTKYNGRTVYRTEMEQSAAKARTQSDPKRTELYRTLGKAEYVWNGWKQSGNKIAREQFQMFTDEHNKIAYDCGYLEGIYSENIKYIIELDKRIKSAGNAGAVEILGGNNNGKH